MKKTRALALVLALVLFCSLLSGCGTIRLLLERRAGSDGGMVSFGDMQYERPDLDAMLRDADAIIASLDESANPKSADVRKALDALFDAWSHLRTMETLATIRSDLDVTDDYYREEASWCTDAEITMRGKFEEVFAACAVSPIRKQLDLYFGKGYLDDYGEDYVYPEALFNLQKQENDLVNRYYAALAAAHFTWNGTDYTLDELYQAEQKGTLEGITFSEAVTGYYTEVNRTLGGIFVELVKLRHAIAAEAGYDDYVRMAYDQNGRDFTPKDVEDYTAAIKTELVPLYRRAVESGLTDDAYMGTPARRGSDSLQDAAAIADALGGDIAETANFLLEYDLINADVSNKKISDSYEIYLTDYEAPYVFAGTAGYAEDVLTILHELGHAVDDYVHYEALDSTDVSETLSQGLEYLGLPYLDDDIHDSVLAYKLADVLRMYAEQGSFNAFEERVYALPDADVTLENINAIALDCAKEFAMESEWGEGYDAMSWVEITHFFQQPLYIISYLASDSMAFQFYEQELQEEGRGLELWNKCLDLSEDKEFTELAGELGLRDPLSAEQIRAIARILQEQLDIH